VHDTRKHAAATPDFSFTAEIPPTAHENGHGTPHFPPRGGRAGSEDSGDDSPSSRVRTNHEMNGETGAAAATEDAHMVAGSTRSGRVLRGAAAAAATRAARQASEEEEEDADDEYTEDRAGGRDAATPTPRPRNRRKGAAPTKTE